MAEPTVVAQVVSTPPETETDKERWFAHNTAFGLPEGTVRALIAMGVIFSDLFMNCWFKWAPPSLDTWATVAFTYYFVGATMTATKAMARVVMIAGVILLASSAQAAWYQTEQITVDATPAVVGMAGGRTRLKIKNAGAANSPGLLCGNVERTVADYYPLAAGEVLDIGDGSMYGSTAETVTLCASANATPQVVAIVEEGRMLQWTGTPTATRTSTPTNTPTNTDTPTRTPTNTLTNTPTLSPTPSPTPTDTQTPTETPTPSVTPTNT